MIISGVSAYASYAPSTASTAKSGNAASAFASTLSAAAERSATSSDGGVQKTDFTRMTRKDLVEWVNTKIKNGEMSLDGTEAFVGMTMRMPVNGGSTGLDDTQQVDFMQTAQDGMAWARQHGETTMFNSLQEALSTMQRYQGQIQKIDLSA